MSAEPTPADRARVTELLGREPQGQYSIAARDASGDPVVIENAPFLDDGTPMPTMFWLIGPEWVRRIGQLEAAGGVDAAESAVDPDELAAAHARYAELRDAKIPHDHTGPRPSGGVGGTRTGVKCLHAHWAWQLAGGDDPVGRWIAARLDEHAGVDIQLDAETTTVTLPNGRRAVIPLGFASLTAEWLTGDPPHPAGLTNALGAIADHLDDTEREHPDIAELARSTAGVSFGGATITSLARLELGRDDAPPHGHPRSRRRRGHISARGDGVRSRPRPQSWTTVAACRDDHRHVLRGAVGDAPVPSRAGHPADRRHGRGRGRGVTP